MGDDIRISITGDSAEAIASIQKTIDGMGKLETKFNGVSVNLSKAGTVIDQQNNKIYQWSESANRYVDVVTRKFASMKDVNAAMMPTDMPERLDATNQKVRENADAVGMTRKEWMKTGSEAIYYVSLIAGKTNALSQNIVQGIDLVRNFGEAFMFGGPAGATLAITGTSLSLLVDKLGEADRKAQAAYDSLVKPFKDLRAEIEAINNSSGLDKLAASAGVAADALSRLIKQGGGETLAKQYNDAQATVAILQQQLDGANKVLSENYNLMTAAAVEEYKTKIANLSTALDIAKRAEKGFGDQLHQTTLELDDQIDRANKLAASNSKFGAEQDYFTRQGKMASDAKHAADLKMIDDSKKYADALKEVAKAQDALFKSMLEKSLTPTSVTDADMQATKAGTYKTKWDEFARRAEAIAKGTNVSQFGAAFEAQFNKLGLSAEQAAAKFRDFSLFADPANLKLVDWNAVTTDIGTQLQQLVGKANLMKEGMAKAWAGLSASQKATLRELGIESASDAAKQMLGVSDTTTASLVKGLNTKDNVKAVKDAGSTIIANVTGAMLDKDTQKTWTSTADTLVQNMIAQFVTKDNTKALKDSGKGLLETMALGMGESTALSDALVRAVQRAIADGISAAGGSGGSSVTINYTDNSVLSLADKNKAAQKLAPIIQDAQRSIKGRQANVP